MIEVQIARALHKNHLVFISRIQFVSVNCCICKCQDSAKNTHYLIFKDDTYIIVSELEYDALTTLKDIS